MDEVTISREEYEGLLLDRDRIDWLAEEAETSRTGVSVTHLRGGGPECALDKGFRLMRYHRIFHACPSLRAAIDSAREE